MNWCNYCRQWWKNNNNNKFFMCTSMGGYFVYSVWRYHLITHWKCLTPERHIEIIICANTILESSQTYIRFYESRAGASTSYYFHSHTFWITLLESSSTSVSKTPTKLLIKKNLPSKKKKIGRMLNLSKLFIEDDVVVHLNTFPLHILSL